MAATVEAVLITPEAFRKLQRTVQQQALEISNLQRTLQYIGLQRHQLGFVPGLQRARLTEDMDDDNKTATANVWQLNEAGTEYVETEQEVELRSFLRPEGETIADRTRVYYGRVGNAFEIIVCNCAPDPEEA